MPLPLQNIPIVFTKGVNTKADPKTVQGEFLELENAVFTKIGTLTTRYGYDALSQEVDGSSTTLSTGEGLAVYGDELVQFSGGRVYSYATSTERWLDRGVARSCVASDTNVIRNTYQQTDPDIAETGGVRVVVWSDSRGGVRCNVLDSATGAAFQVDVSLHATAVKPRVVAFNGELVIFYVLGGNLFYRRVSALTPSTMGAEVNPISALDALNNYDVATVGSRLFVAYNDVLLAGRTTLVGYDTAFAAAVTAASSYDSNQSIALVPDTVRQEIWLLVGESANRVVCERYSYALVVDLGSAIIEAVATVRVTGAVDATSGVLVAFYEVAGATNNLNRVRGNSRTRSGTVGAASSLRRGVGIIGRAFIDAGIGYVPCAHESPSATAFQSTAFLLDADGAVVARLLAGELGGLRTTSTVSSVATSGTDYVFAATRKGELVTESSVTFTRSGIATTALDFSTAQRFQSVESAGALHIVGGALQMYDGRAVVEHGFHLFPEGVTGSMGGGGVMATGAYQWRAVYEWTDRTGRVHRSAPSPALSLASVSGVTDAASITVPTLRLTAKADVRIVLYRTLANGTTFYRLTSPTAPVMNDPTVDTVTIADGTVTDAVLAANEFLYTTGDVLDHIAPGACSLACNYRGRIVLAGLSDPLRVAYSKLVRENEPAAFNDALTFGVDALGGPITALAPLDDKLVIFKATAIYVVAGNGPTDTADSNDYGDPQMVTNDVGSEGPVVVQTPLGLMFKSAKGVYLLDRALGVKYIGDRVEAYNGLTITSGAVVPDTNQVRFITSTSRALVYDYAFDQWSTFTNHAAADCDVWDGSFVMLRSSGRVLRENTAIWTDEGQPVEMYGVTGWIQAASIQGFQRVQRLALLGDYYSGHTCELQVGFDFAPTWLQSKSVEATSLFGASTYGSGGTYGGGSPYGGTFARYGFSLHLARQKCEAIRFSFRIRQTAATPGQGAGVTAFTLRVGAKVGLTKLPAAQRF